MASVDALTVETLPELSSPRTLLIAFSGWSDAGSAATNAVQYVAAQMSAQTFASIDGEEFFDFTVQRPLVRLDEQQIRQLDWPGWQFSTARNLVFATGPEPHLKWRTFCGLVERLLEQVKIERVALLGAFLAEVLYTDPVPLTGFSSDPSVLERLRVSATAYQGPTGIVGALADRVRHRSLPLFSLWAAIPHYIAGTPNPRGTLALLLKLREWMELAIDLAPLESAAATFQSQLLEAVEGNAELSKYIRNLKKGETSH
jgi:hypothetical protein